MSRHVNTPMGPVDWRTLAIGLGLLVLYVVFAILTQGWWV